MRALSFKKGTPAGYLPLSEDEGQAVSCEVLTNVPALASIDPGILPQSKLSLWPIAMERSPALFRFEPYGPRPSPRRRMFNPWPNTLRGRGNHAVHRFRLVVGAAAESTGSLWCARTPY